MEPRGDDRGRAHASPLGARAGTLLDWTDVDKALLLCGVPLPLLVASLARVEWLVGHPDEEPYLSRPTLRAIRVAIVFYALAASALCAWGLRLRRQEAPGDGFVQAALFLFFFTCSAGAYFVGHFSTPILGACVAGIIAAQLLFETRVVRPATVFAVLSLFAPVVPIALRLIPYAPLYQDSPFIGPTPARVWLATVTGFSLVFVLAPLAVLSAVLERWRAKDAELHRLARLDGLTEVPNRRYFLERLEIELVRVRRYGGTLSVLLLDLDHFKRINDRHGHPVGDRALVAVARALSHDLVRRIDTVGRYGGEEFAVLLPETDLAGALVVAERIRAAVEAAVLSDDAGRPVRVTTSIGVAVFPSPEAVDLGSLVRRADGALYRAKSAGRNRVETEPLEDWSSGA